MLTDANGEIIPSAELSLKALFNTVLDSIIVINSKGIIVECNKATYDIFGYEPGELYGRNVSLLMPQSHAINHDSYIQRFEQTGEKRIIGIGREVQAVRKNGAVFHARLGINHFMEQGLHFYVGTVQDITEEVKARSLKKNYEDKLKEEVETRTKELQETLRLRQQAEERLLQSQKVYTTIARNYPNGAITILDRDFNYTFVEGKGLSDLGIDSRFLLGTNYLRRLRPELQELAEKNLREVLNGKVVGFELEFSDHFFMVDAVPLHDQGKVEGILMIETNITHLKRAEREMLRALNKEKELGELKSRFVSMASHEFRTPLSTIMSSAGLIEKYNESGNTAKVGDHVVKIRKNISHLNQILDDFLSLGKLEEGLVRYAPKRIDLVGFAREMMEDIEPNLKSSQRMVTDIPEESVWVSGDHELLRNVFVNLLSNAIKYSDEVSGLITLKLENVNGGAILKVSDNGMGIPDDDQKNLFSRFFRARNVTNIQGTGLGLHLVKLYLDIMGGRISFESKHGEGSTFEVFLPLSADEEENPDH
jgi:PAS domain S-box-containing protein